MYNSNPVMRYLLFLSALGLLLSIALNFYIYQRGRSYYLELSDARLDPLGLRYFVDDAQRQSSQSAQPRVIFFGDSRAAQWSNPKDIDNIEFVNRGIGSQTTAQVLGRFSAHVAPLQPAIVILQVGINDLKTLPLFPERQEEIIANCKTNIQQIVDRSLQADASVILTTIFPLGQLPIERRLFWSEEVALAIDDVNQFLYSLQSDRVRVFDTASILATKDTTVDPNYSRDFLHLNQQGYEALNRELSQILHQRYTDGEK